MVTNDRIRGNTCTKRATSMFSIEQHIEKREENRHKTAFLQNGTRLAKPRAVKKHITYKEVMVAFGIIVAVLVALTLWDNHRAQDHSTTQTTPSIIHGIAAAGKGIFLGSILK